MKLHIGEAIRSLRKEAGLTQEQLADKLGVSYQSVSRWELGVTYPDMELLPALTECFGVSADVLLGIPKVQREKEAEKALTALAKACREEPLDTEKVCALIREIRRDHLHASCFWNFWFGVSTHVYCHPAILPEVRLTVEAILESNASREEKEDAVEAFAALEDDEHIEDFLNRYAATRDLQKDTLLLTRYRKRGDKEKADLLRQEALFRTVDKLVGNSGLWLVGDYEQLDLPALHAKNKLGMELLNALCREEKGVGRLDLWVEPRLWMGFREAGYLAAEGKEGEALEMLEDSVSLLESALAIRGQKALTCNSPWLKDMVWTATEQICTLTGEEEGQRELFITDTKNNCFVVSPAQYAYYLTTDKDDRWYTRECRLLDPIRKHPRYLACVERVEKLLLPVKS
ncbi:MAG: helix-turn-helix transcriptional regulator [Clostridia bacterium]|nr:helix-turn-helix transcriptional regulator [Clostridia bacterium]